MNVEPRFDRGHAVIIGAGGDLPATVSDAKALADLLTDPACCAYPPRQVQLLSASRATRDAVLAALAELDVRARSNPEITAIFYFSGHGVRTPAFHLLPHGFDLDRLAETAIHGDELTEALGAIPARKLVVILDCCHAGGQAGIGGPKAPRATLTPAILAELTGGGGRVLLASSRQDELSLATDRYSEFTLALLEGLAGYGAFERDGFARVLDVAMYVGRVVANRTRDRQHPILKVADLKDNFALGWYAGGETRPKRLALSSRAHPPRSAFPAGSTPRDEHLWCLLASRREALLLIEERMSEFVEHHEIPLQLIRSQRRTVGEIEKLENRLGMGP